MKQKPRWTLEMLTASLAVLCGLLVLVLLIQRPTAWPALLALVVLWGVVVVLFRCQLRKWVARWMCGGSFEGSKLQFSLEPLSQPAALLSGETVLWYNAQFRTRLLNGQDALVSRVQKVLPGLDLQQCRKQEGQLLTLADGMWSVHSSTVPGDAESMPLHQRVNRSFFHGKTSVVQRFHPRKRFAYIRHFQQNILFVIRHFLHLFISYGSFPAKFLRSPENFRKENRSVGRLFTPELRANKGFSIFSRCSRIYNPCRRGKLFRLSDSSRFSRSRWPSRRRPASPYLPSYRF